jgi:glycosyltransferase involved in cell wall biosynthesis
MSPYPKISVITPSFNQGLFLEQTIQSVLNQNYPCIEYIIIDGGSSDATVGILKKYSRHITYWISECDSGQSEAINKGLKKATGEIVCWLNSDDLFEANALNIVSEYFSKNPEAQFVYGDGVIFYHDVLRPNHLHQSGKVDHKILSHCDPLQQPSVFWRRGIHDEVGYIDEALCYTMDWDFFMRISLKFELHYLPISLSKYRIHASHKTSVGGAPRSVEILHFIDKYSSQNWKLVYKSLYPYVSQIRDFRHKFGWRLGRIVFLLIHPKLFIKFGFSALKAMNMF